MKAVYLQRYKAVTWLVPGETAAVSTRFVYTLQPCILTDHVTSLHAKPHTKDACVFSCNLPPALLQNNWDLLRATAVTWGWNGYRSKSQHRKLTLEKKTPAASAWTFRSRVRRV